MPFQVSFGVQVSVACVCPFQTEKALCEVFLNYHWYFRPLPVALTESVSD